MSTAIIGIVIVIICVFGIRSYTKRLSSGCCGGGGETQKRVKPADKNAENYPYVKKIKIEGMTCPNCAVRIENAFNRIDGMWAKVDSSTGYGTIMMKQEKEDEELKRIVQRAGYTVVKGEL